MPSATLSSDPLWFKDAVIYEVPVRAFADSDGDGVGDFLGLTEKLDYLQELGVTAIWVLPFFPSPLRDDGYDISDYTSINPIYGTLEDFQACLDAAHQRGIRVIIELIVNHTSDQHAWFQRARRAPEGSPERDFYVWSNSPEKYAGTRIIFKDFETSNWTWDPVAKSYYWHRFYSHQPDLNFENPVVQTTLLDVVDFWLEMGVDGLRLDAVPYLFEREGTNCENLPETHDFLKKLRRHVDEKFPNRMLLAEANQWPEDAVEYYGSGDECHMDFHFPLMPRLFMSVQMEDSFPIIDILQQTPPIPDNCQWALFLRNHDELTLEMVSDEDRDYMYRVYAQDPKARINLGIRRRLAPLLGNNRRKIELMNALLMSLPGTPVLYYGDELGMGDNIYLGDRNGVRTPMQWSADRNAGFSHANPQRLYEPIILDPEYHYEAFNVQTQQANPNSLWWWMKRLIGVRKRFQAFGRGTFEFLYPDNRKVLAFIRTYEGEHLLCVSNLSRFVQCVELDLSAFVGLEPIEIFGRTEFPRIQDTPYMLSLGPHTFYWFSLQHQPSLLCPVKQRDRLPTILVNRQWDEVFTQADPRLVLERFIPDYLCSCTWFAGLTRVMQATQILDVVPVQLQSHTIHIVLLKVDYVAGDAERYMLYLTYTPEHQAPGAYSPALGDIVVQIQAQQSQSVGQLWDALSCKEILAGLLQVTAKRQYYHGKRGQIFASPTEQFRFLAGSTDQESEFSLEPRLFQGEQSHTSVIYGDRLILKLFRKVEEGINPELEVGRFLSECKGVQCLEMSKHLVPVAGTLEYQSKGLEPIAVGVIRKYVPDVNDAWSYTLDRLRDLFEAVSLHQVELEPTQLPPRSIVALLETEIPEGVHATMGTFMGAAQLLGQRTAELHLALAMDTTNPAFAPEAFNSFYQRSVYQFMRNKAGQALITLKRSLRQFSPEAQSLGQEVLNQQDKLLGQFKRILDLRLELSRIRCHGDFSLREVLFTGMDFIIIDFEGDPTRPLSERRMKRSPLRDVTVMLESFYYASQAGLQQEQDSGMISESQWPLMQQWARFFYSWAGTAYLQAYLAHAKDAPFLPQKPAELQTLLHAFLLEKAIDELDDELHHRPDWVHVPLQRLVELMQA